MSFDIPILTYKKIFFHKNVGFSDNITITMLICNCREKQIKKKEVIK